MNDWPVRFIGGLGWQRGYDRAMSLADDAPPGSIKNPYSPDLEEFFGFEEGRIDAARLTGSLP